jgi:Chalcone isomerase-like
MRLFGVRTVVLSVALLCGGVVVASDMVGVSGSKARFPARIEVPNGGKPVKLALTGTALRSRTIINQYAVASYLQEGVKAKTADQLAAADAYKVLHLIIETDLNSKELADAIGAAIRNNGAKGFTSELQQLRIILGEQTLKSGQEIVLTWLPKSGVRFQVKGKTDVPIANPAFARALWDAYFGSSHQGDSVKAGLTSRL